MTETTDLEKKSLEAHVDLCAERYRYLHNKLETVEGKIESASQTVQEVHGMVHALSEKINERVISWAVGLVFVLIGIVGFLLSHYLFK